MNDRRSIADLPRRQFSTYCVEKVERQHFGEASDVQQLHDRVIATVLVSLGCQDFCPEVNIAEFFNTIDLRRSLVLPVQASDAV
jgi:hypothetical protein